MAEITKELGRIPVTRGEYEVSITYYKDNIVQYKRGSYQVVSESPIIGVPPTNDKNVVNPGWTLFAGTLDAQDVVNQIKEQEAKSIQAVAAREAEILAKSDAAEVSFDNTGTSFSETNVQDALKKTDGKLSKLESEVIYDVTANNDGATFPSLSALLSSKNLSTLIPTSVRHGGMSIRFVQSSDNKYVQYFLPKNAWNIDPNDWEKINIEKEVIGIIYNSDDTKNTRLSKNASLNDYIGQDIQVKIDSTIEDDTFVIYGCNDDGTMKISVVLASRQSTGEYTPLFKVPENGYIYLYTDTLSSETTRTYDTFVRLGSSVNSKAHEVEKKIKTISGLFVCETESNLVAKVVDANGFTLIPGGSIKVNFTHTNTAANPTLNINSTGAKKIIYNGNGISDTNTWKDGDVLEFYYDPSGDNGSGVWIGRNIGYDSALNFTSTKNVSNKDIAESVFSYQLESGYHLTTIGDKPIYTASDEYKTILVKAKEGDVYTLKGHATNLAKLWFTCDQYHNIVRLADIDQSNTPIDVTIAKGEEWIGFNSYADSSYIRFSKKLYILNKIKGVEDNIQSLNQAVYGVKESKTYTLTKNRHVKNDFSSFASEGEVIIKVNYDSSEFTRLQLVANDGYNVSHATTLQPNVSYRFKCYGYNVILSPILAQGILEAKVTLYVETIVLRDYIDNNVSQLKSAIGIKNNLVSDGFGSLPYDTVVLKNGTPSKSNYGMDNVIYSMTLPEAEKYRIFFRWKFTSAVPYVSNSTTLPLLRFGKAGSTRFQIVPSVWPRKLADNTGYLVPQYLLGLNNYNINSNAFIADGYRYRPIMGGFAFMMRFTGDVNLPTNQDIVVVLSDSAVVFKHSTNDTVIESVSYNGTDTIDTLLDAINSLTDFEATGINVVGHICSDIITDSALSISMVSTYNTSSYDANPVYVPLAHDTSWHTLELLVDNVNNTSWLAIDGMTNKAAFNTLQTYELEIGSIYNGSDSPLSIRDLEINIDSWADAEVVTYKEDPQDTSSSQMAEQIISSHNPRLLLFEGHGINDCMDVDAPTTPEGLMATSTDRLLCLFDALKNKGYMPITWKDVIDWKMNGKELPKRCYTLMFDDFRIENYMDYAKRKPFEMYNVKPGLALITGSRTRAEQVTVDSRQYNLGRVFDMITLAGWYPCSHTSAHRYINKDAYSQEATLLKQDVLECNDLGIYSDIIVYPYGSLDIKHTAAMMNSCFQVGVYTASKRYNCMASGNFFLTRYEIGTRVTIEQMLMPIV